MIKSLQITQLDNMLKLLKSNVAKIDKRLNCDIVKEPKESIEVVKKKATINKNYDVFDILINYFLAKLHALVIQILPRYMQIQKPK